MKVLFVFNKPLDVEAGGVERVTASVMKGLSAEGVETFYLQDTGTKLLENGVPVTAKDFFSKNEIDVVVQQLAYNGVIAKYLIQEEKEIPYVVAWHTDLPTIGKSWRVACTRSFQGGLAGEIKRLLRIVFFPFFYKKEVRRFRDRWKGVLQRASKVLLLSESFIPNCQKLLNVSTNKICIIPNPLSFSETANVEILLQKEKEVVIVSRMKDLQKRISLALKIWKLVENSPESEGWYLKIIGEGEDLQTYKKMTKLLNLHRVVFLGRQNPQPFYVKASLAMMTSSFEGWGLTLTESQQFGVVPLAFDSYASAKDIVTNGENGFLIPYGDLKLYSILLLKLMKNAELRHKMAASAIKSVKRFEIDEIVSRWLALLNGVAGAH